MATSFSKGSVDKTRFQSKIKYNREKLRTMQVIFTTKVRKNQLSCFLEARGIDVKIKI
jgi:hypothetical protein